VKRIALLAVAAMALASLSVVAHALTIDQPDPIAAPFPPVTVTLTGTVAVGNTVEVVENGALQPACTPTADAAGNWSCSIVFSTSGTFVFTVTERDAEGVVASDTRTVLVQPTPAPPTAPPTTTPVPPDAQVVAVPARFTG
jgi:hypothetical protein